MKTPSIRPALPSDLSQLAVLRNALWPESSVEEHARELAAILATKASGIVPMSIFVAVSEDGSVLGFLEASLRSTVDSCDTAQPVGYVEGWYVVGHARRQGCGRALLRVAEDWARAQGCREIASDTPMDNPISQQAHSALGFSVSGHSVNFRKFL